MASSIAALCNGVVTELNAGSFTTAFTAVFQYLPNFTVMEAETFQVVVTDLYRVGAGTTGIDDAKMEICLNLLEEITQFLALRKIGNYSPSGQMFRSTGDKDKSHYMATNLEERLFAASLRIPYQTRVDINRA